MVVFIANSVWGGVHQLASRAPLPSARWFYGGEESLVTSSPYFTFEARAYRWLSSRSVQSKRARNLNWRYIKFVLVECPTYLFGSRRGLRVGTLSPTEYSSSISI